MRNSTSLSFSKHKDFNLVYDKETLDRSRYADLHLQNIRELYAIIEVINNKNIVVNTIEGKVTGGNISVNKDSLIRRTGNLTVVDIENFIPKDSKSLFWINNKIKVWIGIKNQSSIGSEITYFLLGTFYIANPSISNGQDGKSMEADLKDMMLKWEQRQIKRDIIIEPETPIDVAMKSIMNEFGEWDTKIEPTQLKVPYTLEFKTGTKVVEIIEKIRDLYMDWIAYYDLQGTFHFEKEYYQNLEDINPVWDFCDKKNNLNTTESIQIDYENLKNKITVLGKMNTKTGLIPKASIEIMDENHRFHESNIGLREEVIEEAEYYNNEQCYSKARYEIFKKSNFQEKINHTTVPLYFLDVGDIILFPNIEDENIKDEYIVENISVDLDISGTMNLSGSKLYHDITNDKDESIYLDVRKIIENVKHGIVNKGWLNLSEQRIEEYFNIKGDGETTVYVDFITDERYGVTAYVIGYNSTTNQSLTIDIYDFIHEGESGNTGGIKSDYLDRILGHEVFHIVLNNYLGTSKTALLPIWFSEGYAEFVHGADERLKTFIAKDGKLDSVAVSSIAERAFDVLYHNKWDENSFDYSVAYVIVKYIDKKLQMLGREAGDILHFLKDRSFIIEELKNYLNDLFQYENYEETCRYISDELFEYIKQLQINLDTDERDTGSIGGLDHRGEKELNAEDIFDNSKAEENVSMYNFNVVFNEF